MLIRRFVCELNHDTGELGWRPIWQPSFDPLAGMTVAHDTLEHFPDDDASAEDEFQALGASTYIRGITHWYSSRPWGCSDPAMNIASDIPDILLRDRDLVWTIRDPRRTLPLQNDDAETIIREAVAEGVSFYNRDFLAEDDQLDEDTLARLEKRISGWMRRGYARAARRYRQIDRYSLAALFTEIMDEADRLLRCCDGVGEQLRVMVNLRRCRAQLDMIPPELEGNR
jgi:hypothetical protein